MNARTSLYQKITLNILEAMKTATHAEMPWYRNSGIPQNAVTEKHYQGINILNLWATASIKGYTSNQWATYKQWSSVGANVKVGEQAALVLFYQPLAREDEGNEEKPSRRYPVIMKASHVFNVEQTDGHAPSQSMQDKTQILANVEAFIANTGAVILHGGNKASYSPVSDMIRMPDRHFFTGTSTSTPTESYYSVLLHELIHWTGHKSRCNRKFSFDMNSPEYAKEELVAELGAAFLCSALNISTYPRQDHANYLSSWIELLTENASNLFAASKLAGCASDHLHRLQTTVSGKQ